MRKIFSDQDYGRTRGKIISTHRMKTKAFDQFIPWFALTLLGIGIGLVLLMGCASVPGMSRAEYMSRANKFDTEWAGKERTSEYRTCYPVFFNHLMKECKPIAEELFSQIEEGTSVDESPYWECCDDALDAMEECLDDQAKS